MFLKFKKCVCEQVAGRLAEESFEGGYPTSGPKGPNVNRLCILNCTRGGQDRKGRRRGGLGGTMPLCHCAPVPQCHGRGRKGGYPTSGPKGPNVSTLGILNRTRGGQDQKGRRRGGLGGTMPLCHCAPVPQCHGRGRKGGTPRRAQKGQMLKDFAS